MRSAEVNRRALLGGAAGSCALSPERASNDTVFELRNYELHPGRRDELIALFEREFVESQEGVGARVVGAFHDLDAPDQFVWLRSFADMPSRAAALTSFYSGPAWRTHRTAANATMIDSTNAHLLRPIGRRLRLPDQRPPIGARAPNPNVFVADIFELRYNAGAQFAEIAARDAHLVASFETEPSPNNFPALPVRAETVFVTLRRFPAARANDIPRVAGLLAPEQTLRLRPTGRSLLR